MNLGVRTLTADLSVVKSRLQAGHAKYKSALDGMLSIIKNEGVGGVYKGVGNKLLQSVLTAAILFVGQKKIYEVIKKVGGPFHDSIRYPRHCQLTRLNFRLWQRHL